MQLPDVRVGVHDDLAIQLEHQTQHPMRRRLLRPKIECVIADLSQDLPPRQHFAEGRICH